MARCHRAPPSEARERDIMEQYRRRAIGLGRAAELLEIHLIDAQALLATYDITLDLTFDDLAQEIADMRQAGVLH